MCFVFRRVIMALHRHRGKVKKRLVSKKKAKKILEDGSVRGKKLTKAQKGLFGAASK